jgi:hypothetical protein
MVRTPFLLLVIAAAFFTGCSSPSYTYRYVPGRTAVMSGDTAVAPPDAPERVKVAIAAANQIVGSPYQYGGGHGRGASRGFDCSGTASYVLQAAGVLDSPMPSRGFRRYGASGPGEWISIYARKGHVFLVVAGLRLDTGYTGEERGPRWTTRSRPAPGSVIRHPSGL